MFFVVVCFIVWLWLILVLMIVCFDCVWLFGVGYYLFNSVANFFGL